MDRPTDPKDILSRIKKTFILREGTLFVFLLAVILLKVTGLIFYVVDVSKVSIGIFAWFISGFIFRFLIEKQKTIEGASNLYLAYDVLFELPMLTFIIANIGTVEWMGPMFYLFPIVYTNIVFSRKRALLVCSAASVYYVGLVVFQYLGIINLGYYFINSLDIFEKRNYLFDNILFTTATFYLIGLAANLFAELLEKRTLELEEARRKLESERKSLEEKVQARTKELENLAASLDIKIKEGTRELRDKLGELEKFSQIAIGREMAMIDLKKKIKDMEEKLKNTKES